MGFILNFILKKKKGFNPSSVVKTGIHLGKTAKGRKDPRAQGLQMGEIEYIILDANTNKESVELKEIGFT